MARPRFRFGLARAPHEPPTSGGYRGALVRLQARDGFHTSDNNPSLAIAAAQAGLAFCSEPSRAKRVPSRASASITGCVRKSLLRLRPSAYLTRDHRLGLATALRLKQNACRQNTPAAPAQSVNWESTTLAPAFAARPKASVDIPSWRRSKISPLHYKRFCGIMLMSRGKQYADNIREQKREDKNRGQLQRS